MVLGYYGVQQPQPRCGLYGGRHEDFPQVCQDLTLLLTEARKVWENANRGSLAGCSCRVPAF